MRCCSPRYTCDVPPPGRLPVIAIEDALPPPQLPALVWLMVAHSKGLPLSAELVELVMGCVYDIAATPWRESSRLKVAPNYDSTLLIRTYYEFPRRACDGVRLRHFRHAVARAQPVQSGA